MLLLALVRQYEVTRHIDHLEEAASAVARSIRQPIRVTTALIRDLKDHAALLNVLRQLTQQPQSLDRLIAIINQCVQDVPPQSRLALLAPLAEAHFDRFQHWGNRTDLDRAIELHEELTQAPDVDPQERLLRVNQRFASVPPGQARSARRADRRNGESPCLMMTVGRPHSVAVVVTVAFWLGCVRWCWVRVVSSAGCGARCR
ncbi:hypothetical protein [Streptomyces sp. NPDC092370]|uniref:hypothetical protein n=1 Tax=Streptomyces sp. NPDC092370 TaxID=3366016 RepID=UPI0038306C5B